MSGEVLEGVLRCLREELPEPPPELDRETELLELPGVDSVVIVALLTRLEEEFEVEIDPALISPESFATAGALSAIVSASLAAGS